MISIIVPVYNVEQYLGECLSSISSQSYHNFEVLLINDGSTDNSVHICKNWVEKDSRFKLFSQDNHGVSSARNLGLNNIVGDYVCFVDGDDTIHEDYLKILLNYSCDCDLVICDYTREDNLGCGTTVNVYNPKDLIRKVVYERIKHPNIVCFLYKRSIIEANSIRFTIGCIKNEDTEFYIRYLVACKNSIAMTSFVGYYYRPNPASVMFAPLTLKSLTSIEASRRINLLLYDHGIITDSTIVLNNGILTYAYSIAKQGNTVLYDYLHKHYDVNHAMKKMLLFPRMTKKMVALTYLILGKRLFFKIVGYIIK